MITSVIATPLSYLVSPLGMIVIVTVFCLSWFFGIHGGSVVFTAIMPIYIGHMRQTGISGCRGAVSV